MEVLDKVTSTTTAKETPAAGTSQEVDKDGGGFLAGALPLAVRRKGLVRGSSTAVGRGTLDPAPAPRTPLVVS